MGKPFRYIFYILDVSPSLLPLLKNLVLMFSMFNITEKVIAILAEVLKMGVFNKIAIPNNKFQMASGQGSHWLIQSPTIFSSMCSQPLSNICQFYF